MNSRCNRRDFLKKTALSAAAIAVTGCAGDTHSAFHAAARKRPNILWIIAEDMSPNWSCYGETTIETPNIDRLAEEGVMFRNAFVTSPVCSPSRSAMITGMYPTTIGAHHHRSSWPGSEIHLPKQMKLLPEFFRENGYYTANGGSKTTVYHKDVQRKNKKMGKTDYNFVWDRSVYDDNDWQSRPAGQPFFAQIQLRGGKYRGAKVPNPVDPADVKLPPYYPDHPVIRRDWANYLNSVLYLDIQVGKILKRLDDEGIADNTVVILWTDHGISHARGKQFLYDEGIGVPLIMRRPGVIKPRTVRDDMVSHIDIAATSLDMAGIVVPDYMQGRVLFGRRYRRRRCIFAARDRCDETLDCIRAVRTERYKYIRNFYPYRAGLQPNRYKDAKEIIKTIRSLYAQGKLNEIQSRIFDVPRPVEELYDLKNDPYEINNLAHSPSHQKMLVRLRRMLVRHMIETKDLGLIPEPCLEQLAKKYDSPFDILRDPVNGNLLGDILDVIELNENEQTGCKRLIEKPADKRCSIRWWAARKLANVKVQLTALVDALTAGLNDDSSGVRVECARSLCRLGFEDKAVAVLVNQLKGDDQIVRYYAALALEDIGQKARPALEALKAAQTDKYEYVRRVAHRLVGVLQSSQKK